MTRKLVPLDVDEIARMRPGYFANPLAPIEDRSALFMGDDVKLVFELGDGRFKQLWYTIQEVVRGEESCFIGTPSLSLPPSRHLRWPQEQVRFTAAQIYRFPVNRDVLDGEVLWRHEGDRMTRCDVFENVE